MSDAFERLFTAGRAAVLAGEHQVQEPPFEGGRRWGFSALLRPDAASAAVLEEVAREAVDAAGGGHWLTGTAARSHLTVRCLEHWRAAVDADDPAVRRYAAALATATAGIRPLRFRVVGLTLTPSSVLACAVPSCGDADRMAGAFAQALGPDGWLERDFGRDLWYLTLVHFTEAIKEPERLVAWVAERRAREVTEVVADEVQLAQFVLDGEAMVPRVVVSLGLS